MMKDIAVVGTLTKIVTIGGEGTGYALVSMSIPVIPSVEGSIPAGRVKMLGHFESKSYPLRLPMWVFVATKISHQAADDILVPEHPMDIVIEGTLRGGIVHIGGSGPSHRLDDASVQIDVPSSARALIGKKVTAIGDFQLRSYVERQNVLTFVATRVETVPENPQPVALDAAAALAAETDYVAAGTHAEGINPSTSEDVVGGSGRIYHCVYRPVMHDMNEVTQGDDVGVEAARALLDRVEAVGFRKMTSTGGEFAFLSYHVRLKRGDYTHEVSWSPRAPGTDDLSKVYATVIDAANPAAPARAPRRDGGGGQPDPLRGGSGGGVVGNG